MQNDFDHQNVGLIVQEKCWAEQREEAQKQHHKDVSNSLNSVALHASFDATVAKNGEKKHNEAFQEELSRWESELEQLEKEESGCDSDQDDAKVSIVEK